jgi:hypothetical protein
MSIHRRERYLIQQAVLALAFLGMLLVVEPCLHAMEADHHSSECGLCRVVFAGSLVLAAPVVCGRPDRHATQPLIVETQPVSTSAVAIPEVRAPPTR